jgi:ribosome modulation factor
MEEGWMKETNIGATAADSPVMQGRNAREYGRGRESCPYPEGSAERQGWLEGFDDLTADDSGKSRVDDADRA